MIELMDGGTSIVKEKIEFAGNIIISTGIP
jgi:hypothetical protein